MASIQERKGRFRAQTYVRGRRNSKTFPTRALAEAWADRQECRVAGMPAIRAALEDHRIASVMPARQRAAIERANYSAAEILECAFPLDSLSGIYFLIRQSEIYYVGQTTNVLARLAKHKREGRAFDSFTFIPCPPDQLNELESIYIAMLLPHENGRL